MIRILHVLGNWKVAATFGVSLIFLGAMLSQSTVPTLLFDEFLYTSSAYNDYSSISTEGFLYSLVYSLADFVGNESFYSFAKLINFLFLLGTGLALYRIARLDLDRDAAAWVASLVMLFPMATWSFLFMPEQMFICLALWALYFLIYALRADSTRYFYPSLVASAVLFGVSALVKVHSLFLFPAIVFAILYGLGRKKTVPGVSIIFAAAFMVIVFASKLSLGYLLAGERGLRLFGGYQEGVSAALSVFFPFLAESTEPESPPTRTVSLPNGGFYVGFEDTPRRSVPDYSYSEILLMTLDRAWSLLPIALIAFGWIVFVYFTKTAPEFSFDGVPATSGDTRFSLHIVFAFALNLFLLAIVFNVFATVTGDDHSQRVLFRYAEYIFLPASVLAASLLLRGQNRNPSSVFYRLRHLIPLAILLLSLVGGQGRLIPNYADSTFIPVMGNLLVWLPITIIAFSLLYWSLVGQAKNTHVVAFGILTMYSFTGLLSALDYVSGSQRGELLGWETSRYIETEELTVADVLILTDSSPRAGRVATLLATDKINYGQVLGTNPVSQGGIPDETSDVIAVGPVLFDLDLEGIESVRSGDEFEHFKLGNGTTKLRESLEITDVLRTEEFSYYSDGTLYSKDSTVELTLASPVASESSDLRVCLRLPTDVQNRQVEMKIFGVRYALNVTGTESSPASCFDLGLSEPVTTLDLSFTSQVLQNELDTGELLSEVGLGISELSLR